MPAPAAQSLLPEQPPVNATGDAGASALAAVGSVLTAVIGGTLAASNHSGGEEGLAAVQLQDLNASQIPKWPDNQQTTDNVHTLFYDSNTLTYFILSMVAAFGNFILIGTMGLGCLTFGCAQDFAAVEAEKENKHGTCCCIVPCLLDYEDAIIVETVEKALAVPQLAMVVLSYNTKGGDVTRVVQSLEKMRNADKRLVLLHNAESRSKAANLNAALPLTEPHELVFILDADHHVNPSFVETLAAALHAAPSKTVCMQGSVLVRGPGCWDATLNTLSWYFFSIIMTMFQAVAGTCMFVGAGAAWRGAVLREYAFSDAMIAEDDDLSMRVIRAGMSINVWPQAELTELAPDGVFAFMLQRLRWTYGYEQSMDRHIFKLACQRPRALTQRLYAWYSYLVFFLGVSQGVVAAVLRPKLGTSLLLMPVALLTLPIILIIMGVVQMLKLNGWKNWLQTCLLLPSSFLYGLMQALLTIYARFRMLCGFTWLVTRRKIPEAQRESSSTYSDATRPQ